MESPSHRHTHNRSCLKIFAPVNYVMMIHEKIFIYLLSSFFLRHASEFIILRYFLPFFLVPLIHKHEMLCFAFMLFFHSITIPLKLYRSLVKPRNQVRGLDGEKWKEGKHFDCKNVISIIMSSHSVAKDKKQKSFEELFCLVREEIF